MDILRILLLVVEVITCLLLVVVILLQQSKSQGLGLAFGGGMGESLFGARAGNVLTKTTIILSTVFLVNTTFLAILYTRSEETSIVDRELGSVTLPPPGAVQPAPSPQTVAQTPPPGPAQGTLVTLDPTDVGTVPSEAVDGVAPVPVEPAPEIVEETVPVRSDEPATP